MIQYNSNFSIYSNLVTILTRQCLIYFIFLFSNSNKHNSLSKLVEACQANVQSGLACRLTEVAIKPRSANLLAEAGGQWDIPRTELTKDVELGRGNFGIVYKGNLMFQQV